MRNLAALLLVMGTPFAAAEGLDDILNFHTIDDTLATSGQVKPEHVPALTEAGFELVINLAPADPEQNQQEAFLVAGQNIAYANIPVDWENPTDANLQLFYALMNARDGRKTLVHCFANYRASAFTYAYRVRHGGVSPEEARADMFKVWTDEAFDKFPRWAELVDAAAQ